ncbi:MAG: porin family protein [Bacteroidota bacterium]
MKKILFSLMMVGIAYLSYGQAKIEIGLKGGANFSNTDFGNSESITAFHGGAFLLLKVANIGIQPEVLYSSQGSEVEGVGDINLDYINIPIIAKFYLPLGLNLQLGPQFGVLTDDLKDLNNDGINEQLKSSDLSAVFGAGVNLPFRLKVDARYVLGLSDINDSSFDQDIKNRMFQLSIGYSLFKLGK